MDIANNRKRIPKTTDTNHISTLKQMHTTQTHKNKQKIPHKYIYQQNTQTQLQTHNINTQIQKKHQHITHKYIPDKHKNKHTQIHSYKHITHKYTSAYHTKNTHYTNIYQPNTQINIHTNTIINLK